MRTRVMAVAAGVLLVAGGGWAVQRGGDTAAQTDEAVVAEPVDYVALGDSYTAGPLIPMQRDDAPGCFRSTLNYPALLADLLDVATYADASCSGARSEDVLGRQDLMFDNRARPQVRLLSEETDLVTIGLGGNDFGLFGSISGGCGGPAEGKQWLSKATPCRDRFGASKARDARRVRASLGKALDAVREAAPDADVYVVGYPRLLPDEGSCRVAGFTAGDAAWARRVAGLLNRSLRLAAEDAGATYVDLYPVSEGHDICAGKHAWVNGVRTQLGKAAAYHPFQAGMEGAAGAVYEAVTGEAAPVKRDG